LPPLEFEEVIAEQARAHSIDMVTTDRLSHNGFSDRVEIIKQVIPYDDVSENVAFNMGYAQPDDAAIRGWIKSSGHNQNMLGNYDLTGIGVAESGGKYYFTQILIREK
jgi:uncharacterized protein YkwD